MQNPWDVRPRSEPGDSSPDPIYLQVGQALTAWEILESMMAELFDVMVTERASNRAAFAAFTAVKSSSARTELLEAAAERALPHWHPAKNDVTDLIAAFGKSGARRNEIAHGRVYDMEKHGYWLGPNNVMPHKWTTQGAAKYQYRSDDIAHYADLFRALGQRCADVIAGLKARKTNETSSRDDPRDKRT